MNPMHGNRFAPEFDEMPRVGFEATFVGSKKSNFHMAEDVGTRACPRKQ